MSPENVTVFAKNAAAEGTAAAMLVADCQRVIDNPEKYTTHSGDDGEGWGGAAMRCAFAYKVTQKPEYLTEAIKYWQAALDDDQDIGDKGGCVAGVDTNWQTWDGSSPSPPILRAVTYDAGVALHWIGPYVALSYDWLNDAPGVTPELLDQTRVCLTAWVDYYSQRGYLRDVPGASHNAGLVIAKALAAVALGNDGGGDGHLWTETTDTLFPMLLVGEGLKGASDPVGSPAGALAGGDWLEGWQYGASRAMEYAVAARALQEGGVLQPEMASWTDDLAVRYVHGTTPDLSGQWFGGEADGMAVFAKPDVNQVDAVLAGLSSDEAASYAAFMKQEQAIPAGRSFYNALAELRVVTPADMRAGNAAKWYLARGARNLYSRTSWKADAFWTVFSSAPSLVPDHQHLTASNFVLSRGADALIVDSSRSSEINTLTSNALTAESGLAMDGYVLTQTPVSEAELSWARVTADATAAARSDLSRAFLDNDKMTDIPYAHREWTFLPEGEVVTIDRAHTPAAANGMIVGFYTNTGGKLMLSGAVASGDVGGSKVAIHTVSLSSGAPEILQPEVGECSLACNYPCGECESARFAVDKYKVKIDGPWAVAVHVIDALAKGEAPATVGSLNDDTVDPAPKQNAGVLGASVLRGTTQSYVVASSAMDGVSPATMTYGVPGGTVSRHVVFDAPEDKDGQSTVSAEAKGDRCVITITAGAGFAGRPLMFTVSSASDGCKATESTEAPPGTGGSGGGGGSSGAGGTGGDGGGGCGCRFEGAGADAFGGLALLLGVAALARRRRRG